MFLGGALIKKKKKIFKLTSSIKRRPVVSISIPTIVYLPGGIVLVQRDFLLFTPFSRHDDGVVVDGDSRFVVVGDIVVVSTVFEDSLIFFFCVLLLFYFSTRILRRFKREKKFVILERK